MSAELGQAKIEKLERQESFETARKRDYDCFSCRVMGASAFGGLGVYSYITGHNELTKREAEILKSSSRIKIPARRMGVTVTSAVLVGLGLYRLFV
ncbi:hypothetical protein CAC42_3964 [Sphaceloma murrayae]|uniref:Distal membrane-arm assembly complex protein 1-like domain-containing protein n=1 Tax=Sphaceloma murrayae TaxID=2082308 RepID=A0A2K1QSI2_9PEZI|nr:hypothetical protein CAC42_3964 [Sphaceloma murrayae]